jgi:hypothetical protein
MRKMILLALAAVAGCSQEQPEVAFKRIVGAKVAKIEGQTMEKGEDKSYKVGTATYDVKKTDSLVSPFAARVIFPVSETVVLDGSNLKSRGTLTVDYLYSDGHWELKDALLTTKPEEGDGVFSAMEMPSTRLAEEWGLAVGKDE